MRKSILCIIGTLAVVSCILLLAANYIYYSPANSTYYHFEGPPFYVTENDAGYAEYKALEDHKFWSTLSDRLDAVASDYCKENAIDSVHISVYCSGGPTYYSIGYNIHGAVSVVDEYKLKGLLKELVNFATSVYDESLAKMTQ